MLGLLEIFDFELLREKLILFLFQVRRGILFGLVEVRDFHFVFLALCLQLFSDVLDGFCLFLQCSNLCSNLVLVILLLFNHVFLL